ncbi:cation:proton antiporter [Nonomuraea longispora]|uniref:Cation:proton antiporter n=1 Tax=Nonomuraea longispora TaxID=1848320 RepID=A0A4R4NDV4_9ACTN|nr:cation:proton antiporter [Nonomuraea longispora]
MPQARKQSQTKRTVVVLESPVALVPDHQLLIFLLQGCTLLVAARLLGALARRIGIPAIVGELTAGMLLGPTVLGNVAPEFFEWFFPSDPAQFHLLDVVAQLGVLLLVALTGAETDLAAVRRRRRAVVAISSAGMLVPLCLGVAMGWLMPAWVRPDGADPLVFALFLGVVMGVSALPVIAKTLMDLDLLGHRVGQLIIASGVVQDIVGWLLLMVVSALAVTGLSAGDWAVWLAALPVLACVLLIGRPVARMAVRSAPGSAVTTIVIMTLVGAATAHAMGMEPVFGALLAGLAIAPVRARIAPALSVVRTWVMSVLAPLFFATVGLRMDLTALAEPAILAVSAAVLCVGMSGKFAGAWIGGACSGMDRWERLAVGAGINARGVVEVIIATVGLRLGILDGTMYTVIVVFAIVTSLTAPPILRFATRKMPHTEMPVSRQRDLVVD